MNEKRGYLNVFLAGVLWGTIGLFVKELQRLGLSTQMTSYLRLTFAFLLMFIYTSFKFGIKAFKIDRKTILICILMGIIVQAACNLFYSYTVTKLGVSVAVVFMDTAPIFTLISAVLLFKEKLTKRKVLAVIIDIVGCVLAATNGNIQGSSLTMFAVFTGLMSGLTYGLSAIFGRVVSNRANVYVLCVYSYFSASVFLLLFVRPWLEINTVTPLALGVSALFGLIPTAISYVLYYSGISMIEETSKVPVIASVELIAATIIGVVLYNDPVGIISVIGIILVIVAIAMMNMNEKID